MDIADDIGRRVTGTVLGVWAHPDDETYLSGGLMARAVRAGGRVVCVHATAGERGTEDDAGWPPDRLGPHRAGELRSALGELGVHESEILGYPDGGCDGVDHEAAVAAISATIRRARPDVVVTFGPDGITGHPDHVAVGRWATDAAARTGGAPVLYAVSTESFLARHRAVHERLGLLDSTAVGIPDAEAALTVRLSDHELTTKRRALAAHASQTVRLAAAMGEEPYRRWYEVETFRRPTAAEAGSLSRSAGSS